MNPHALRRHPLKMVCLPIPPLPQEASNKRIKKGYVPPAGSVPSGVETPSWVIFRMALEPPLVAPFHLLEPVSLRAVERAQLSVPAE